MTRSTASNVSALPSCSYVGEGFGVGWQTFEETLEGRLVERRSGRAVAEPLQVARVHLLLELPGEREREHGLAQVDDLAHEREARRGDHAAAGTQIGDEGVVRERTVAQVSVLLIRREAVARSIDDAGDAARAQGSNRFLADAPVDE